MLHDSIIKTMKWRKKSEKKKIIEQDAFDS